MTFLGVGEIIGSQILAAIRDGYGTRAAIVVLIFETCVAYALLIWYNERDKFDWLAYTFVFSWGI